MSEEKTDFLRRWSRLKREAAAAPAAPEKTDAAEAAQAPQLPPIDSLTFESDFKAFMHSKVEHGVKRAALKKLFSDPRFNVMDGLDTYIDDYSKEDPISDEILAQLNHARVALFGPPKEEEEKVAEEARDAEEIQEAFAKEETEQAAKIDVDPAQDPKAL